MHAKTRENIEIQRWELCQFTELTSKYIPAVDAVLYSRGNIDLIKQPLVGLLCSKKCPGRLILRAHDLAHRWRTEGSAVVSGFHSPVEQECLAVLLSGAQPIVCCPARCIMNYRLPTLFHAPLAAGRLLVISSFHEEERRMTRELAHTRNRLVAALSTTLVVPFADHGGSIADLVTEVLAAGITTVYTFQDEANTHLLERGVLAITDLPA